MKMKQLSLTGAVGRLLMGLGLVLGAGCGAGVEGAPPEAEVTRASGITTAEQGLSTIAPIQDPQLCNLPSGRYVVSAQVTNTPDVYNVTFHNDGVEGSQPSATCKTMKLVWAEGIPYPSVPPQPPAEADFPKRLLEGWWQNDLTPKRFAVKAVWKTDDNLGVITQISGAPARGYFVAPADFGIPEGYRFNWTGAGSDAKHTQYYAWFSLEADRKILITDSSASATYQSLSCQSGTTRLWNGGAMNCPF
jgi:hypothetical protein